MKQETLNKYINTTKGVLTVIDLDHMKNKYDLNTFLDKVYKIYNKFYNESSTTISKESTLQANGNGSGELLTAA